MLSLTEIDTFREQGFLGPFNAFDIEEMAGFRQTITERVLAIPASHSAYSTQCRHLDSRTVFQLCSSPAIVERMAALYGPDLILWGSAFFDKPPARHGQEEEYPWHQDLYNWRLEPMLNISAWLAITPATEQNGCVEVIPGSHKRIIPPVRDTNRRNSFRFAGAAADPEYFDSLEAVPLTLKPGQFFLFNERTLHHSKPNRTQETRIGMSIRVTIPIAKSHEAWPCILLRGQDVMGFNEYADAPLDEPDTRWQKSLQSGDEFVFDRSVPGMGWHSPESDGSRWFSWTSETESWIDLQPTGSGRVLRCDVLHTVTRKTLKQVEVCVNNLPVKVHQRRDGVITALEGIVPEQAMGTGDQVRIAIRTPQLTRPCDVNRKSRDNRLLGLAISRIALTGQD